MELLVEAYTSIRDYFERGGDVLWGILFATILMWTLIIERLWYFYGIWPRRMDEIKQEWDKRDDKTSWYARRIRDLWLSQVSVDARRFLMVIRSLMAVLPLLGLLGTVTGMIAVFDVMAIFGTGNARLMAGGVSKATIPTMSGLVAALSGLYLATFLEQKADAEVERIEDALVHH